MIVTIFCNYINYDSIYVIMFDKMTGFMSGFMTDFKQKPATTGLMTDYKQKPLEMGKWRVATPEPSLVTRDEFMAILNQTRETNNCVDIPNNRWINTKPETSIINIDATACLSILAIREDGGVFQFSSGHFTPDVIIKVAGGQDSGIIDLSELAHMNNMLRDLRSFRDSGALLKVLLFGQVMEDATLEKSTRADRLISSELLKNAGIPNTMIEDCRSNAYTLSDSFVVTHDGIIKRWVKTE